MGPDLAVGDLSFPVPDPGHGVNNGLALHGLGRR